MEPYRLLASLESPADLKNLSLDELLELSKEIRHRIIEVMSVNGGHLASNLGTVELTLALHSIFDAPRDKFVWDVSHQTYAHKLLTGRNARFETVRKFQGLCGFSNPKESEYDHFHAGHAGTALSLALGVAKTRDLEEDDFHVVPILGDASLTCGVTLEAMNNIHRNLRRFLVVLNDNAMSISKNVGAITSILSRFLNNPTSNRFYRDVTKLVSKIPHLGDRLAKHGDKFAESLKNLVSPAAFFEQFGLTYWGPFDGHDLPKLIDAFEAVKNSPYPVILHVLTNKGQGIDQAVKDPIVYHGVKPFDRDTYKFLPTGVAKPTFPKIFGKHLLRMGEEDESIVAVTPAMSLGACLDEFMEKFPDRAIDVGIAESHAITYCGGLAYGGKRKVVASIYGTFLQRALDNLFHDVCLQELPVLFAIDRGGIAGADGATHNGIYDIAFLRSMPNMVIAQPRNGHLLKELMSSAFKWNLPTAIRYPNLPTEEFEAPIKERQLGKGEILTRGENLLLIPLGHMCNTAVAVRELLLERGIDPTIFDPIFVKPLDSTQLRQLIQQHAYVVTIEEHTLAGGLGAAINQLILSENLQGAKVLNIGIPEVFVEHGSHAALSDSIGLSAPKIADRIVEAFFDAKAEKLEESHSAL